MIKIEKTETFGWEHALRGMRNALNSWDKADSYWTDNKEDFIIGENDFKLTMKLRSAGSDHRKFMRMITVYCDITAPLYWWKEFDTYKVGTVANSCSTMHKIHAKEFTIDDFSHEHLFNGENAYFYDTQYKTYLSRLIDCLNCARNNYLETKDKKYWWQMIQLLPSSYNQKRTVMLNYEVLAKIYASRKNHKLDEWHEMRDWIRQLPYSYLITGEFGE